MVAFISPKHTNTLCRELTRCRCAHMPIEASSFPSVSCGVPKDALHQPLVQLPTCSLHAHSLSKLSTARHTANCTVPLPSFLTHTAHPGTKDV